MIMIGSKRKMMDAILGEPKPKDSEETPLEKGTHDGHGAFHECMKELIDAIHDKDVESACDAWKACFQESEREPHEEADHD